MSAAKTCPHLPTPFLLISTVLLLSSMLVLSGCATKPRPLDLPVIYDPIAFHPSKTLNKADCTGELGNQAWKKIKRAEYRSALKRLNKAIEQLSDDTNSHPPCLARLYLQRGIAHWYLGKFDSAVQNYTKAIELQPNHWEGYFHRWQTRRKTGDLKGAKKDRKRGLQLKPEIFQREYSFDHGII